METKPGDKITIIVDGRPYETYIDESGVQRFPKDTTHPLWDRWAGDGHDREGRGTEDMNDLARAYSRGEFDQRTYMEFNMSVGYSVCGFCELSSFHDLRLVNPLWDETEDDLPNDDYFYSNLRKGKITIEDILRQTMERDGITYREASNHFIAQFMIDYEFDTIEHGLIKIIKEEKCNYEEAQERFVEKYMIWI